MVVKFVKLSYVFKASLIFQWIAQKRWVKGLVKKKVRLKPSIILHG
jgi:hypothetical protein